MSEEEFARIKAGLGAALLKSSNPILRDMERLLTEVERTRSDARLGEALREALADTPEGETLEIFRGSHRPSFAQPFDVCTTEHDGATSKITPATRALAEALRRASLAAVPSGSGAYRYTPCAAHGRDDCDDCAEMPRTP